jgi:hypothetical protein
MGARTRAAYVGLSVLLVAVVAACTTSTGSSSSDRTPAPSPSGGSTVAGTDATDWSPDPVDLDGLAAVAAVDGTSFVVHTASGDKTFVPGVNLGSTTPLHQPGELAITAADYGRWFAEMGDLGVRAVRVYTIHPPAFYDQLAAYNEAHSDAPLYLVQGVYLPDESAVDGGTWYDDSVDEAFTDELKDASAAVHGDLSRSPLPGRASGDWTTDVSPWLIAWIVGVEWDPDTTARTDQTQAAAPAAVGRYFRSTPDASPTERWIARHMDTLARAEVSRGSTAPMAFVNWPTTDPLKHPDEPLRQEDLVGVDANHVKATPAWPAGTFASFHAYPYYPDFMHRETAFAKTRWDGGPDAYAGYLQALKRHFASMPLMITETGVPSSLGSAHTGTNGRDQGHHTEQEAMETDADLVRLIEAQGLAGALIFEWTDEWFKRTWNTELHQDPERRQLWHDPLTNEQWFGVVATDSDRLPDAHVVSEVGRDSPIRSVSLDADASYLYADLALDPDRVAASGDGSVELAFDVVPSLKGPDYKVELSPSTRKAAAYVRAELDPIRLDTDLASYQPDVGKLWHVYRLIVSRQTAFDGDVLPAGFEVVGRLVEGSWDPDDVAYDSLATWQAADDGSEVRVRLPWPMVGFADPSSRTVLGPGNPAALTTVPRIHVFASTGGYQHSVSYTWPTWNHIGSTERLKTGASALADAFAHLAP